MPATTENGAPRVARYWVVRDGTHVIVLVTADDGLPVYYLTDGMFVGLDPERPGGLCVFDGGEPTVAVASGDEGSALALDISFTGAGHRRQVVLDGASLLRAALRKTRTASSGAENNGIIAVQTERAEVTLRIPAEASGFGVSSLSIRTAKGMELTLSDLRANTDRTLPAIIGIDRRAIEGLNLPIRVLEATDSTLTLFIPEGFPRNPTERDAAVKLQTLFPGPESEPKIAAEVPKSNAPKP